MPIAETAAVATIIGKLLSMSTDLLERKESKEIATEIRDIQKFTIQLQSLYSSFQAQNSELHSLNHDLQSQIIKLEKENLKKEREYSEILKRLDEWDQYERKVGKEGFVYFAHKTELHIYACAVCKGKEPYPMTLQPTWTMSDEKHHYCKTCKAQGLIE